MKNAPEQPKSTRAPLSNGLATGPSKSSISTPRLHQDSVSKNDEGKIVEFLEAFHSSGEIFEIRILGAYGEERRTEYGFFDNPILAANAIRCVDSYKGVYTTLNPIDEALRSKESFGSIQRAGRGDATSHSGVRHRQHILVDFDPERSDKSCLLYTSPSPRDATLSRMPSSA